MHPGQFLKAEDVKDKAIVATMSSVEMEMVGFSNQARSAAFKKVIASPTDSGDPAIY